MAVLMEQSSSNSALISLMEEPVTARVNTFTPWPDLEGLQGFSGATIHGVAHNIAVTNSNFIVAKIREYLAAAKTLWDELFVIQRFDGKKLNHEHNATEQEADAFAG